jgi:hypothetical protein
LSFCTPGRMRGQQWHQRERWLMTLPVCLLSRSKIYRIGDDPATRQIEALLLNQRHSHIAFTIDSSEPIFRASQQPFFSGSKLSQDRACTSDNKRRVLYHIFSAGIRRLHSSLTQVLTSCPRTSQARKSGIGTGRFSQQDDTD